MKFLSLLTALLLTFAGISSGASYFVTQSGAGSKNGTSLGNAWSIANFNSTTAPTGGDTVFFSGTITSPVVPHSNGTGNGSSRLTLNFSSATLNAAPPEIQIQSRSFLTLTGGTISPQSNGEIIYFYQQTSHDLTIDHMTFIGPAGGTAVFAQAQYAYNFTVSNCKVDNVSSAVVSDSANSHDWNIINNYFRTSINTATQTDVIFIGDAYNITIQGNMLIQRSPGDNSSGQHNDIIQTFHGGSGGAANPSGWIVRYNWIGLQMETPERTGDNSWMQLEQFDNAHGGFGIKIYGNVFFGGDANYSGNNGFGWSGTTSGIAYVYNNTIIRHNGPDRTIGWITGGTMYFRNNVGEADANESGTFIDIAAMTPGAPYNRNFFYRFQNATTSESGSNGSINTDPLFVDYTNNNFALQANSPLVHNGDSTIGSEYNQGIAPGATWPNPTLVTRATGAWDVGAFQSGAGGSTQPAPTPLAPQSLRVQ